MKQYDSNSNVIESCEESPMEHRTEARKHYTLHGKCNHTMYNCNKFETMITK